MSDHGGWVAYRYEPSLAAAIVFAIVFSVAAGLHVFRLFKARGWYWVPFTIGVLFEAIGYIGRALSSQDQNKLSYYIMQTLLLLVAPALFAASIYMTLSRLAIATHGEQFLVVRPRWLTTFFVCGDVLSFLTQSGGGGIMSKGGDSYKLGQKLVTAGLFIQVLFFGGFIIVASLFNARLRKSALHVPQMAEARKYLFVMYGASFLILVRSIFRIVEYIQPEDSYIMRHEYFLYIFDAVLMTGVVVAYLIVKPFGGLFDEWKRRKDSGSIGRGVDMEQVR